MDSPLLFVRFANMYCLPLRFLVQEREIEQVMMMSKSGKAKETRAAAYDLAAMATSSDDNKFRIVAEGGLEVLTKLALL